MDYKTAKMELEQIITELESEEPDIDTLSEKIKRATELIAFCNQKLRNTEKDINNIFETFELNTKNTESNETNN